MAFDLGKMARRVRSWCVDNGETYADLAEAIGVKESTVKSWVYGSRPIPLWRAVAIADHFGKSLDELACRA